MSVKARPITAALIFDLAAKFWYHGDDLDILLHSILVVGLNFGLRFDEVAKFDIDLLSVDSEGIRITLRTQI